MSVSSRSLYGLQSWLCHLFVLITYSQDRSSLNKNKPALLNALSVPVCSVVWFIRVFTSAAGSGRVVRSTGVTQSWPWGFAGYSEVVFFHCFHTKSPTCCCIHNDRRCFFCVCLFMVIQKDMVGFFKHLRLLSVCAVSMWAFIIETCCVQPLNGFNFQTTAPAVIRCQTFTEMFLMVFLRWHHGSLFRPLWVSTVQLKLCCFSWLLLFHCE